MTDQSIHEAIRNSKFFEGMPDGQLQQLVPIAREFEYRAQQDIFHEYDLATTIYLVLSGSVSLVICDPKVGCRQITEVNAGELIGWSPLLDHPRFTDTAHTITPVKVLAFDAAKVLEVCQANPAFGMELIKRIACVLAERLIATRQQLLEVHGHHLPNVALESD